MCKNLCPCGNITWASPKMTKEICGTLKLCFPFHLPHGKCYGQISFNKLLLTLTFGGQKKKYKGGLGVKTQVQKEREISGK